MAASVEEASSSVDLSLLSDSDGEEGQLQHREQQRRAGGAATTSGRKHRADDDDGGGGGSDGAGEEPKQRDAEEADPAPKKKKSSKKQKLLSEEKLRRLQARERARGIVYVSRMPPHMKPGKLRQLLAPHGALGRVYCTPEDAGARRERKRRGGDSGRSFTEGWVEFEDKRAAKLAAAALNGTPMGGKRRSAYHFDLWNLKYLPKFKWETLSEEVAYEAAVREQRLAAELAAAKRERDFYLSRVDAAKALDAMAARRAGRVGGGGGDGGGERGGGGGGAEGGDGGGGAAAAKRAPRRPPKQHFEQRRAIKGGEGAAQLAPEVLGLVAARPPR